MAEGHTVEERIAATVGLAIGQDEHRRSTIVFTCIKCGTTHSVIRHIGHNPTAAFKKTQKAGWSIRTNGGHPICPTCREKLVTSVPTNGALKGQIALIRLLDEHFDGKAGIYAAGYSDTKLAQLTDLKEDYVASIREAGFGKLINPHTAAVAELRKSLESQFESFDDMLKSLRDDFNKRLAALETKVGSR